MITRRNWLLRCSIIINIAVLVYVCSQLVYRDNSLQLPATAYLIQQQQQQNGNNGQQQQSGSAGLLSGDQTGRKKLSLDSPNVILSSSSSNILNSKLISVNGIGVREEQSVPEAENNNVNSLLKMIPKMDQHLQEQQQQDIQQQQQAEFDEVNDNNADDSRFEVPTEALAASNGLNIAADVINLAPSTNATVYGDGFVGDRAVEEKIKTLIKCYDREYLPETVQRGDFWVLKNYVRANHGPLRCFETLTYTTHADYTFLDNLIPLLERWMAPISIALHAPGTDYAHTVHSIKYLRECAPEGHLVRQFVTFHIYFSSKHIPKNVLKHDKVFDSQFNCSVTPPFINASDSQLYKTQKKMLYPVNVGRNVARDAAMTYFFLASDIELYPNPGLVSKFLRMVARNEGPLRGKKPRVFPLPIFEVDESVAVPRDKTELQEQFRNGKAILFHKKLCPSCHGVPKSKQWMVANETDNLGIFHVGKRVGSHLHWEPIYIGSHQDPHYDERLSWEGKSDKMTQGYALCALDYEFLILDNAFLVHKPGIKVLKKDPKRAMLAAKTNQLIRKIIYPELQVMYGVRKGCAI